MRVDFNWLKKKLKKSDTLTINCIFLNKWGKIYAKKLYPTLIRRKRHLYWQFLAHRWVKCIPNVKLLWRSKRGRRKWVRPVFFTAFQFDEKIQYAENRVTNDIEREKLTLFDVCKAIENIRVLQHSSSTANDLRLLTTHSEGNWEKVNIAFRQ